VERDGCANTRHSWKRKFVSIDVSQFHKTVYAPSTKMISVGGATTRMSLPAEAVFIVGKFDRITYRRPCAARQLRS
jgi:hypothetical protein